MKTAPLLIFIFFLACSFQIQAQNPEFAWAKGFGSTGNDFGRAISVDINGNIWIIGEFENTVDFDPSATTVNLVSNGSRDIFLAKYSPAGNLLWAGSIGGTGFEFGSFIKTDASGNVYISGDFSGTVDFDPSATTVSFSSVGSSDAFFAKFDNNGNLIFARALQGTSNGKSLALDASGNIWLSGNFLGTTDFDPSGTVYNLISNTSSWDIFLAKYDASGNFIWAGRAGNSNGDFCYGVEIDILGNVWITGEFKGVVDFNLNAGTNNLTSGASANAFLAKYDLSGNFIWAGVIGGASYSVGFSIAPDSSGNIYMSGAFQGTTDFDPSGTSFNLTENGLGDAFIAKYSPLGNLIWVGAMGSSSVDNGQKLILDAGKNLWVTGDFARTVDFDITAGVYNLSSVSNGNDIFLAKYDTSGSLIWAGGIGSTTSDRGMGIARAGDGTVVFTGYFTGSADFDPFSGVVNLPSNSTYDIFLLKLNQCIARPATSVIIDATNPYTNDGRITATTDGNLPHTFIWEATTGNQTTALATGLYPGTYCVTITTGPYAAGCPAVNTLFHCATIGSNDPFWQTLAIPRFTAFQGVTALAYNPMHLRFSVYDSVTTDTLWCGMYYKETNDFGAFSLKINNEFDFPNPIATSCGGLATTFPDVAWHTGNKWLRVQYESNIGTGFTQSWKMQLASQFYAFSSRYAENIPHWHFEGGDTITHTGRTNIYGSLLANNLNTPSDQRYKKDITTIPNAWASLASISGVRYQYRPEAFEKDKQPSTNTQIGLIAQEVEKIYPEMVQTNSAGYKTVDYTKLTPVLLEAIKERQDRIEKMQVDNAARKEAIEELKKMNASTTKLLEILGHHIKK